MRRMGGRRLDERCRGVEIERRRERDEVERRRQRDEERSRQPASYHLTAHKEGTAARRRRSR